jgi:hypothetical protein
MRICSAYWLFLLVLIGCDRAGVGSVASSKATEIPPVSLPAVLDDSCEDGKKAYEASFYQFARESVCMGCHAGNHLAAPPWAGADVLDSYHRVKSLVDFSMVDRSTIVIRALNGHCNRPGNPACSDPENARLLSEKIQEWWVNGESKCDDQYRRVDPLDLGSVSSQFKEYTWDISKVGSQFSGLQLTVEVKGIIDATTNKVRAYIIRKPRFISAEQGQSLRVRGIRFYLNGSSQPIANAFDELDVTVSIVRSAVGRHNYAVLSPEVLTMQGSDLPADKLFIGIKGLEAVVKPQCSSTTLFRDKVMPELTRVNSCLACHRRSSVDDSAIPYMSADVTEACAQMRQYVSPMGASVSTLFEFPLNANRTGHPSVEVVSPGLVRSAVAEWVKSEFPR